MTTAAEIQSLQADLDAALTLLASFAVTPQTQTIATALATAQAAAAQLTPTVTPPPPTPPTPAQTQTIVYDTTGSYTWTAPPAVTAVTVNGSTKTVVPGTVYPLLIGGTCSFNGVSVSGATVSLTYAYSADVATGVSLGQYEATMAAMSSGTLAATCANMKAIGSTYVRIECIFTGGTSVPTTYDTVISAIKAAGMQPWIVLEDFSSDGAGVFATGSGSYAAWCPLAVEHFVALIGTGAVYELANEVNLGDNWASGNCSPTTYATCINAAVPAMLAVDSKATVLFSGLAAAGTPTGATTGASLNPVDFLAACYDEVSPLPVTAMSLHPYTWSALGDGQVNGGYPNEAETYNPFYTLGSMYASMSAHGDGAKKIWGGEFGYEIGTVNGSNDVTMTADQQAAGLAIAYQVWAALDYTGPFLMFSYEDEADDGDWGLYTSGGTARPAVAIFEANAKAYAPPTPNVPNAASGLTASVSGTTVTLNWTNGSGATGVHIYQDGTQITGPSGTPTTFAISGVVSGSHSYYVIDYNSVGNGAKSNTANVTVTVVSLAAIANQSFTENTVITPVVPVASGGTAPLAWTVTPALPAGLTISAATGHITGTPSVSQTAATYTVKVTDANGLTASRAFTITIAAPAPPSTSALISLWSGSTITAAALDVTQQAVLDFAYSSPDTETWTIYTLAAAESWSGLRLILKVGALTESEATTIAGYLIAGGQANAIIADMWEMNQNSWYPLWNQTAYTAAEYQAEHQVIVNAMMAVEGAEFEFAWCCNGGDSDNAAGRTTTDTFLSGNQENGRPWYNYVCCDQYDNQGSPSAAVANVAAIATFAAEQGLDWGLLEWGLWGNVDDPEYIDAMASEIQGSDTCFVQSYFSLSGTSDLTVCLNSKAQYIGKFGTPQSDVPAAPVLATPTVSGTSVSLSWSAPEYALTYGVYRDGVLAGEGTEATSWVDVGVAVGTHEYTVFAINSGGTAGPNSNEESATVSSGGGGTNAPYNPNNYPELAGFGTPELYDPFNTGSLNTELWTPYWFDDGAACPGYSGCYTYEANVSVGANGLACYNNGSGSGSLVAAGLPGDYPGAGEWFAASDAHPVYTECQVTLWGGGSYAGSFYWWSPNVWPNGGELDIFETGGELQGRFHTLPGNTVTGPLLYSLSAGQHRVGCLQYATHAIWYVDGAYVGGSKAAATLTIASGAISDGGTLTGPSAIVVGQASTSAPAGTTYFRYIGIWQ